MRIDVNDTFASMFNKLNFEVRENGYAYCDVTWNRENQSANFARMYYVIKGQAILEYNNKQVVMYPNHLYFVPPGMTMSYKCFDKMEKLYFHFNLFVSWHIDYFADCNEVLILPVNNIKEMVRLYGSDDILDIFRLKYILHGDIIRLMQHNEVHPYTASSYSNLVYGAMDYIDKNISAKLHVAEVVENLYISESKLTKLFTKEVGVTIGKYIDNLLILKIEEELADTDMTSTQIAEKYQFSDDTYFSKFFKKKTGYTPKEYRYCNCRKQNVGIKQK